MSNEKTMEAPQYSEVFKEAIDRLPDVDSFINIVAGALDSSSAFALKNWKKKEAETRTNESIAETIQDIIKEGCYDEHEFRHIVATRYPETYIETKSDGKSGTDDSNKRNSIRNEEKLNTFSTLFDEYETKDNLCVEFEQLRTEIETEIKAATLAQHSNVMIVVGDKGSGKTRLLKSITDRLQKEGLSVYSIKQAMSSSISKDIINSNKRFLIWIDDLDTEIMENPQAEIRIERIAELSTASFLFTMTDETKSVILSKHAKMFHMPRLCIESVVKVVSEHTIKEKRVSRECATKIANLLQTHSAAESLQQNALHALRLAVHEFMVEHPDLQKGPGEIKIPDATIELAVEKVLGVQFKLESAEECRKKIEEALVGQRKTIDRVFPFLNIIHSGFSDPEKPLGVFLFYGPSGVGKTELAKVIADSMFGGRYYKEDMNTYSEKHSVSRLIGSPPGYIGHGEVSALMRFIDKEPSGVILLDEIEKAHADIREALMELMDTGFMRDAAGKLHDARRFLIIMTSNISLRDDSTKPIGFGAEKFEPYSGVAATNDREDREYLVNEGTFTKELIGRLQLVSKFSTFSSEEKVEVAKRLVKKAVARLSKFIESTGKCISEDDISNYANESIEYYSEATGARGMKTFIDTCITSRILGITKD